MSDTFTETLAEIISDSIADVTGAVGKTPSGNQYTHAKRALNRLVKRLDANGEFLWRFVRRTAATVAGTAAYTLGSDVLDVDDPCMFRRSGTTTQTPITAMSRDDYTRLADRTNQGMPNLYLFERTLTTRTLTLWPVPDATGDTLEYVAVLRGLDMLNGSDTADFPTKWLDCLRYGLSASLAPAYNQIQLAQYFTQMHEAEKAKLIGDDTERGNVIFSPGYIGGGTE